jgi:hypothetical protein
MKEYYRSMVLEERRKEVGRRVVEPPFTVSPKSVSLGYRRHAEEGYFLLHHAETYQPESTLA